MKKFTDCVNAKRVDGGVLLTLKDGIKPLDLLIFDCFNGNEKIFKYSGDFNKYGFHTMMIVSEDDKRFSYVWGNSTTCTNESTWRRNRVILKAIEELGFEKIYQ